LRKNKESQAALEFLTTYVWAFLGILIVLGALYYFGIFDFSKYLPEKCVFTSQLECLAFVIEETQIKIKLVNNLGETINVESATITDNSDLSCTGPLNSGWLAGTEWDAVFTDCTGAGLIKKERMEAKVSITYYAEDTPTQPRHTINGKLYGRVK
jgi:hypothetical protein